MMLYSIVVTFILLFLAYALTRLIDAALPEDENLKTKERKP